MTCNGSPILCCRASRKSKGIALVQFAEAADALAAKGALDGSIFQGRLLHVLPAHRAPPPRAAQVRSCCPTAGCEGWSLREANGACLRMGPVLT